MSHFIEILENQGYEIEKIIWTEFRTKEEPQVAKVSKDNKYYYAKLINEENREENLIMSDLSIGPPIKSFIHIGDGEIIMINKDVGIPYYKFHHNENVNRWVCNSIEHLYKEGYIHLDLHAGNIIINEKKKELI